MTTAELYSAQMDENTMSLDLHGQTKDEAKYEIDEFLHRAQSSGERAVKIIHGRGQGTLMELVRETLKNHPLVRAYEGSDNPHEIGGVTYALLS